MENKSDTIEERKMESSRIIEKYPNRIPCILSSSQIQIKKNKFLVPELLTLGQFVYIIRKKIRLSPEKAIFIFINGTKLCSGSAVLSDIYKQNKNEDGFLYLVMSEENSFGN
jgi:GABA(A) receptor-associated protein